MGRGKVPGHRVAAAFGPGLIPRAGHRCNTHENDILTSRALCLEYGQENVQAFHYWSGPHRPNQFSPCIRCITPLWMGIRS
jgi:hypothetical protein